MRPTAIAALLGIAGVLMPPATPPTEPVLRVDRLTWLEGRWSGPMWGGTFHAHYTRPGDGRLLSFSELRSKERVQFHEFEVFEDSQDGVTLKPYPGGKPAVELKLTALSWEQRKATFENPKKDYPTRIVYHRVGEDRLTITLDDPHGGGDKREVFDLKRR